MAMIPYILIILAFLADRLSKQWAASFLSDHGPTQINAYLTIRETYNKGIAFGMFQGAGPLVGWFTIAVVAVMFVYLVRLPQEERFIKIGLALIIGGALGNMIDRVTVGQVLDFIETPFRSGIFNVADMAINVGMVIIILGTILSMVRARNQEPVKE
jgi:signal peptidase II